VSINFRTVLFVWLAAWLFYFGAMEGFGGAAQFPPSVEHPIGTTVVCLDVAVFALWLLCRVASVALRIIRPSPQNRALPPRWRAPARF
jgi:hypothetical protein